MTRLSIVIPAYNEADRIVDTLLSFHAFASRKSILTEFIVVDDGSTDNTVEEVQQLQLKIPHLKLFSLPHNQGKGAAVREGMLQATGDIRLFSDADGATPIEELTKILLPIQTNQTDISIGSRYLEQSDVQKKQPKYRIIWSRLANKIIQRTLLPGIIDPHCGFKAFTKEAAERIFSSTTINQWSFDLEALALAQRMNYRITEVPVEWHHDERSKGRLSHLPIEIHNVIRIKKRLANSLET